MAFSILSFIRQRRRSPKTLIVLLVFIAFLVIWGAGLDLVIREKSYSQFSYPLEVDDAEFIDIVTKLRQKTLDAFHPINEFYSKIRFSSTSASNDECVHNLDFLILVKSAPQNFQNRNAIRQTWKKPVSGISTKTVFFIGNSDTYNSALLEEENKNKDIVRIHYDDDYYSNTIKTVMELRYAAELCSNFKYALLIDDDYYLSVRNLNEFTTNWEQNPKTNARLYAGFTFFSKPLRHRFGNKWFIDLEEYPFAYFPPYVTAGNVLLSKPALLDIYYATFFVAPFRFDDIYVAICAKKMGILPTHSDRFKFWVESGNQPRQDLIAAHGYGPERLVTYWEIQTNAGYA